MVILTCIIILPSSISGTNFLAEAGNLIIAFSLSEHYNSYAMESGGGGRTDEIQQVHFILADLYDR